MYVAMQGNSSNQMTFAPQWANIRVSIRQLCIYEVDLHGVYNIGCLCAWLLAMCNCIDVAKHCVKECCDVK